MKLMNYYDTRQLLTQLFKPRELAASVAAVLEQGNWDVGQPDDLGNFVLWLDPPQTWQTGGTVSSSATRAIQALAIHYFTKRHPNANRRNIQSASLLVYAAVSGNATELRPQDAAVEGYCWELLTASAIETEKPGQDQTRILFRMIEAVVFKAAGLRQKADRQPLLQAGGFNKPVAKPQTEEEKLQTLEEAIALLEATKDSFKSKQVFQAKLKLQSLL